MTIEQLTLPDAQAWQPDYPEDADAAALGRLFAGCRVVQRPTPGTNEDRRFRRSVEILRGHGWPILSRKDGSYELTFAREDVQAIVADYRGRARSMLRTSLRVRRVLEHRAA